jgi:spore maturation protein CgeB
LCTKKAIMEDVAEAGCRDVRYLRFAFKPRVHFCELPRTADEQKRFVADVAFVGEGDADRLPYFLTLSKSLPGVNLALYGGLWNRHPATRRYFRGSVRGRDFRMALGGAKIAVNLIRRENRDDHVMRTFEGPACGAFMFSERTNEHLELFKEGSEAAYFASAEELADKARYYLAHDTERERIRAAGHAKIMASGHTYKNRLIEILRAALPN